MKLPQPYRKRRGRGGPFTGNYLVKIKGTEVNLGTKVLDGPDGALERARQAAQHGRRKFRDDLDRAVDDMERAPPAPAGASSPAAPAASSSSPAAAAAGAPGAPPGAPPGAQPGAPAPLAPDAVIPPRPRPPLLAAAPSPEEAAEEAEATAAAASETADQGQGADAPGAGAPFDADVIDQFLAQGAEVLVDAQLDLQAALIKRRTGKIAAKVPPDSAIRKMAAAAWVQQLKVWFPADVMLPPWAMALLIPVLAMPAQFAGATEPPPPAPDDAGADDVGAAAA